MVSSYTMWKSCGRLGGGSKVGVSVSSPTIRAVCPGVKREERNRDIQRVVGHLEEMLQKVGVLGYTKSAKVLF